MNEMKQAECSNSVCAQQNARLFLEVRTAYLFLGARSAWRFLYSAQLRTKTKGIVAIQSAHSSKLLLSFLLSRSKGRKALSLSQEASNSRSTCKFHFRPLSLSSTGNAQE